MLDLDALVAAVRSAPGLLGKRDLQLVKRLDVDGDDAALVLGADVAAQCLRAGVLDEVLTTIVPVLLGGGVRFFENPDSVPLEVIESTYQAPNTNVWCRVIRP